MNHGVDQMCRTCTITRANLGRARSALFQHRRFSSLQKHSEPSRLREYSQSVRRRVQQQKNLSTSSELQQAATPTATARSSSATTPESEHWSNIHAEISILKPNPSSGIRARLQQWQRAYGRQGQDEPNAFSHIRDDGYVRPDLSKVLEVDAEVDEDEMTPQQQQAVKGFDFPDADVYKPEYSPGDVCDVQATGVRQPMLAVLLARIGRQYQFYTIKGQLLHISSTNHFGFHTRGLIPREELEPMLPFLPTNEVLDEFLQVFRDVNAAVPRNVSEPVLRRLRDFQRRSDDLYRSHSQRMDGAHDLVADPHRLLHLPADHIAAKVFGSSVMGHVSSREVALYTLNWAVFKRLVGFEANDWVAPHGELVVVDSKETVARIARVVKWVRAYQEMQALLAADHKVPKDILEGAEIVRRFADKAKHLIAQSRAARVRVPAGGIGPLKATLAKDHIDVAAVKAVDLTSQEDASNQSQFSAAEKDIIFFLLMECCTGYFKHQRRSDFVKAAIIRLTEAYQDESGPSLADRQYTWDFLTEIGIVDPWTLAVDANRYMPPPPANLIQGVNEMTELVQNKGLESFAADKFQDKFQATRRDWGDLPVYCIDAESTTDLDDGISIERIPGTTDQIWLHVHVAHPSAFFSSHQSLGRKALYNGVSMYMPQGREPMLPDWVTKYFSLAPVKPVLTYSARITRAGEILESKIQPGIVRNVLSFSLEAVHQVLGAPLYDAPAVFEMGNASPSPPEPEQTRHLDEPDEVHRAELKELLSYCLEFDKKSQAAWTNDAELLGVAQHVEMPEGGRRFYGSPRLYQDQPTITQEDPRIVARVPKQFHRPRHLSPEKQLVEQCMIIAGTVAASYCQQRHIPIVFQGTREAFENPDIQLLAERSAHLQRIGLERLAKGLISEMLSRKVYSAHPVEHKLMKLPAYTQATSPLRRSRDLITMWQIDAAILYDMQAGGVSPTSMTVTGENTLTTIPPRALPFALGYLEKSGIPWSTIRERYRYQMDRTTRKHWLVQMLFRAYNFGEGPGLLPASLRLTVTDSVRDILQGVSGHLHGLSVKAMLVQSDMSAYQGDEELRPTIQRGDIWEVAISRISTHYRRVWVRPVRLIHRAEDPLPDDMSTV